MVQAALTPLCSPPVVKRNSTIDSLKGFAIFLVVWGHCIQYLVAAPSSSFFNDRVFQAIYSFHMPLFMAISGYLFGISEGRFSPIDLIKRRSSRLLLPFVSWSLLACGAWTLFDFVVLHRVRLHNTLNIFWFLPALVFCLVVSSMCRIIGTGRPATYVCAVLASLVLPDVLGLSYAKFMLPYFVVGLLFWRYADRIPVSVFRWAWIVALAVSVALVWRWKPEYYIYTSGMTFYVPDPVQKLFIVGHRYLAGFAGIVWFATAVHWLVNRFSLTWLERIGRYTMGIYILSVMANPFLFHSGVPRSTTLIYDGMITPVAACLICLACVGLTKLIERHRLAARLLLGS